MNSKGIPHSASRIPNEQQIFIEQAKIISQEKFEGGYRHVKLRAPRISRLAQPGQFVMVRATSGTQPLLPRPFSIYRARHSGADIVEILYKVIGAGTHLMAEKSAEGMLEVTGPLGHPFQLVPHAPLWLVGGGYGVGPMVFITDVLKKSAVSHQRSAQLMAFIGARTKQAVLCVNDFKRNKVPVLVSTDDGSQGMKGRVTDLIERELKRTDLRPFLLACGPTAMLQAVAALAARYGLPSQVSLEETMGCGTGVCLSCVCDIKDGRGGSRQRMICRHGPVFAGEEVLWDRLRKH